MLVYQVSGDRRWLEPPYQPTRTKGLGDNDDGGLPEEVQDEIRRAAAEALGRLQAGGAPAVAVPTPQQITEILGVCVGEPVAESYGIMLADEFVRRISGDSS